MHNSQMNLYLRDGSYAMVVFRSIYHRPKHRSDIDRMIMMLYAQHAIFCFHFRLTYILFARFYYI